jgi:PAS domain S-box-containing protein
MSEKNEPVNSNLQPEVARLVRLAKEGIIIWKLDGTITEWNQSAERIYGYTAEEIIGQSFSRLMPAADPHKLSLVVERIRRGETIQDLETQLLRKDGQLIDVSLTVFPIREEMGRVIGVLCLGIATERNRLYRAEREQLFLAAIISSADDAIISKNVHGIVTSWNPGAERIFGYTAEDIWQVHLDSDPFRSS